MALILSWFVLIPVGCLCYADVINIINVDVLCDLVWLWIYNYELSWIQNKDNFVSYYPSGFAGSFNIKRLQQQWKKTMHANWHK